VPPEPCSPLPSSVAIPGLIQEPIQFSGAWEDGRDPGVWLGSVTGSATLCGIAFLVHGSEVSWAKGERASSAECCVSLYLGWHDKGAGDVSVGFNVGGGGARWSTKLTYRPNVPAVRHLITGTLLHLFDVPGSEPLSCHAAFLRGDETKVGRNGLWHLRSSLAQAIPEPWRRILTYGRSGKCETEHLLALRVVL
jgi:hypothetical protein